MFHFPNSLLSAPPASDFLAAFEVYDVTPAGQVSALTEESAFRDLVQTVAMSGLPTIMTDSSCLPPDVAAVLMFPIYRDGEIVSVIALAASRDSTALGVFEIWEPVGDYSEVGLAQGYYSKLERFQNVSSYIRFEKGSGLPGTVWDNHRAAVHNNLPHHPGFLRSAGAMDEALTSAVGIPIFDDDFVASVILISSAKSPLARGIEIWTLDEHGFTLCEGSYPSLPPCFTLRDGTRLGPDEGLPGMARQHGGACVSSNPEIYAAGRVIPGDQAAQRCGLALPYYDGSVLTSVVVLLF
ncbi:MAG: GAF domain-containing protein [Planctomycetaceae bacterium]|nr:GAF domain-containing protein [Planctomycetaceae bacterium]